MEVVMRDLIEKMQKDLAENKVYDAWPFILSLIEVQKYMEVSYEWLKEIPRMRINNLNSYWQEKEDEAEKLGTAVYTQDELIRLNRDSLSIGNVEIPSRIFQRKITYEFFHYARLCFDLMSQVINAALLGERAIDRERNQLSGEVTKSLKQLGGGKFKKLLQLLESISRNEQYQYICDVDNYMKHQRLVDVNINDKTVFNLCSDSEQYRIESKFELEEFTRKKRHYPIEDAMKKVEEVYNYTSSQVYECMLETDKQLHNCIANKSRFQNVRYTFVADEKDHKSTLKYVAFFLQVAQGLEELPDVIEIGPLRIDKDGRIFSADFGFNRVFICTTEGEDGERIIGVADALAENEKSCFYKKFSVRRCDPLEFEQYKLDFKDRYRGTKIDFTCLKGMNGEKIILKS